MMHVFTAGLMGWALANAWQNKQYIKLILSYFAAIVIHGLWNALVIFTNFSTFQVKSPIVPGYVIIIGPTILLLIAFGSLSLLIRSNRELRKQNSAVSD